MSESLVPFCRQSLLPSHEASFVGSFTREAERKRTQKRKLRCEWMMEDGQPRCRWA
jgi:hypothetical protein